MSNANKKTAVHSLLELLVHGQDGGVAHKGEGQDGNSVDGLKENTKTFTKEFDGFTSVQLRE